MMRKILNLASALVLGWLLSMARPAHVLAQPGDRKSVEAAAKEHYKRGRAHHDLGQYDQAAAEYLASYELSRAPKLLFNVAQVYRLGRSKAKAIEYYQQYIALEPRGDLALLSKTLLDELRQTLAEEEAARRAEEARAAEQAERVARAREVERQAEEVRRAEEERRAEATRQAEEARRAELTRKLAAEQNARTVKARRIRWVGLASAGAGVVAFGAGTLLGIEIQGIQSELEDVSEWEPTYTSLHKQGERTEQAMLTTYAAGAAALIVGGVVYYIGHAMDRDIPSRSASVVPVVGSTSAGLAACFDF